MMLKKLKFVAMGHDDDTDIWKYMTTIITVLKSKLYEYIYID